MSDERTGVQARALAHEFAPGRRVLRRERDGVRNAARLRGLWGDIEHDNIRVTGPPEGGERERARN